MAADKERVVTILRQRLQLEETEAAELADRAEEIFLTETGRTCIPDRAFWLWVDLALAVSMGNASGDTVGASGQSVTSIKRGDTTIQYGESASQAANSTGTVLDRVRHWKVARAK